MKQQLLGNLATRFFAYTQMRKKETIQTGEMAKVLGLTPMQERDLLRRLAKSGWIARIRRGLYIVPQRLPAGGRWRPGEYLALAKLMEDRQATYQITGPNAFNLYGLDDQVPQITFIYNNRISGERIISGMKFVLIKVADSRLGSTTSISGPDGVAAIYSSKPRTLLDAIYDWSRFGGIPRGYEWIKISIKNEPALLSELIKVALKYGNQGTIRRIGYLLETMGVEPRQIRFLRNALRPSKSLIPWIPMKPARGKVSTDWGIIANDQTE